MTKTAVLELLDFTQNMSDRKILNIPHCESNTVEFEADLLANGIHLPNCCAMTITSKKVITCSLDDSAQKYEVREKDLIKY